MAEREREVIVTDGGRRGGGAAIIAVVLLIAILVLLFLVFKDRILGNGNPTTLKADIKIEGPANGH